jgi:tetratricopeptide (TPR) repeat protein
MTTEASPNFCAQCGARLPAGARFCPGCGATAAGGAASASAVPAGPRTLREQTPGLLVLAAFLAVGLGLWVSVLRSGAPEATAPRPPGPPPAAGEGGEQLPGDHPPIGLTADAERFLAQLTAKAEAAPTDAAAWRNLAQVQARAAALDPSYGARAVESFRHLLNLTPDDADSVRSLANVYYDQKRYADAAAQYERFLQLRPDDPNVRTDLGTTYLYQQEIDRAVATYEDVIAKHPDFLQAHFNLGLALEAKGEHERAQAAIAKARSLATDDGTRERIDKVSAELKGWRPPPPGAGVGQAAGSQQAAAPPAPPAGAGPGTGAAAGEPAPPPAADYRAEVERSLRAHQILGPKIASIEWPDGDTRARVLVREFPMQSMPEHIRNLFRARLETMVHDAKERHGVSEARSIEIVDAATGKVMDTATQ